MGCRLNLKIFSPVIGAEIVSQGFYVTFQVSILLASEDRSEGREACLQSGAGHPIGRVQCSR